MQTTSAGASGKLALAARSHAVAAGSFGFWELAAMRGLLLRMAMLERAHSATDRAFFSVSRTGEVVRLFCLRS